MEYSIEIVNEIICSYKRIIEQFEKMLENLSDTSFANFETLTKEQKIEAISKLTEFEQMMLEEYRDVAKKLNLV